MRASAPWGVLVALTAPAPTWALGLGDIELHSALNQPFRADIGLTATNEELQSLRVGLAGREVFERSGLERPAFMSGFEFGIARNSAGRNIVTVTSRESVAEPFVTIILEATWSSGTLQREYTVFLDPPVLLPRAEAPIAAPRTGISETPRPAAPIARDPVPQPPPRPQAPAPAPRATPPVTTSGNQDTYGPVQRAETLWGIAERYRPAGATMNQTMVGIYEANRDAFGGNINVLRVGQILRIPGRDELMALSAANATAEVQRQTQAWQQSRGQPDRLVLVPPSPDAVAPPGGSARTAGAASNADVQRLQAEVDSLRSELDASRRLLEVRNQELANLQTQLSADARPVPPAPDTSVNTAPGVDIENTQVFADDAPSPDPAPVVDTPDVEPPARVTTPDRATPTVTARRDEPSLMTQIVGWLTSGIGLVAAGVVAILFGALWFMRRRRDQDVDDVTGQWDALEAGMDETKVPRSVEPRVSVPSSRRQADEDEDVFGASSPFVVEERPSSSSTTLPIDDADEIAADHYAQSSTQPSIDDTMSTSAVLNLDEADPVAEADFHMAYGLYDQAAELLTKELKNNPKRRDLQLKLLEVFFVWGNKDEFLDAAQHLREQMGSKIDPDWDKVLIMGKQICPDAKLFADTAGVRGGVDLSLGMADEGALDYALDEEAAELDLDIGEPTRLDVAPGGDELDLDLTGNQPGPVLDPTGTLDIGLDTAAGLERALLDEDTVERDSADADAETVAVRKRTDPEMLIETQETPMTGTVAEDLWANFTIDDDAMESPTVDQAGADQPTVESPALSATERHKTTIISDDIVDDDRTTEMPAIRKASAASGADKTAEIELNDLGLEISDIDDPLGLDDIAAEIDSEAGDTREQQTLEDAELLSATGITQVLQEQTGSRKSEASEQTKLQAGGTMLGRAEVKRREAADTELLERPDDEFDLDLDDLSAALSDAETVEQRQPATDFDFGLSGPTTPVDLDVGETFIGDDDPTGTDDQRGIDPQTLTEVGTKLDLARAYIDMGDPDGARSILDEVISEGDKKQREEAQSLIDALGS